MKRTTGPGFNPNEVIFCPTSACNLNCRHCFVNRNGSRLKTEDAENFLESLSESGIIFKVGFSGGEPFLCQDFLCSVIRKAVSLDMIFGNLMTNGVWWKTEEELKTALTKIREAGYDGKIGLSWDAFHGQSPLKIASFIKTVHEVFEDKSAVSIWSVVDSENLKQDMINCSDRIDLLCSQLDGWWSGKANRHNGNGRYEIEGDDGLSVPVYRFSQSFLPEDNPVWTDRKWFTDDFCQSTGQVFYVHSNGNVAPCCGFANELEELCIGKITDSYETLMKNSESNQMVQLCYVSGLGSYCSLHKKDGGFTGKTSDMCMFCAYACKHR